MKVLAIIPARGGSKRVIDKNTKLLNGKPLISYTINAAKASELLFDIIISTDSNQIADVAQKHGGKVPFLRPKEFAADSSGDRDYLIHALTWYQNELNVKIDAVCILRPTSPFRTAELIDKGIELLENSSCDSIRSMSIVSGVHHPYWMYKEENSFAKGIIDGISIEQYFQSQLLPDVYRLNGCVDIIKSDCLLNLEKNLYGTNIKILETPKKQDLDIDTPEDFEYCEWLMTK